MSIQGGSREFYRAFLEVAGWARIVVQKYFYFVLNSIFCAKPGPWKISSFTTASGTTSAAAGRAIS